jgi:transcriptional regulator with XRE-family HTH domain
MSGRVNYRKMDKEKDKKEKGRPSKFIPILIEQMGRLFELGLTDAQVSHALGIARSTLSLWKKENPNLSDTIKKAKEAADSKVKVSLYRRATGYTREAEKIFCNKNGKVTRVIYDEYFPIDTAAAFIWLKNRQGWRDRQDVNMKGEIIHDVKITMDKFKKKMEKED